MKWVSYHSYQVSLESPQSLKASLHQLMNCNSTCTPVISQSTFEDEECGPNWKQLIFGLCLLHATVTGRGKYGRLGWNCPYDFTPVDLQVFSTLVDQLSVYSTHYPMRTRRLDTSSDDQQKWRPFRRCFSVVHQNSGLNAANTNHGDSNDLVFCMSLLWSHRQMPQAIL